MLQPGIVRKRLAAGGRLHRDTGSRGSVGFVPLGEPFHRADCPFGFGRLRLALFLELLGLPTVVLKDAPPFHRGIEHLQCSAAGVCLVVVAQIGEPFKDTEQILVPAASADLDVASVTLRTKRPKPRDLVSAFGSWRHSEASEDAHQVKRLALAGLTRVLVKPDADPVSVLGGSIEQ